MAHLVTCRFCNGGSINHDHDECARAFGERVENEISKFFTNNHRIRGSSLPAHLENSLQSTEWQWYLQYKGRCEETKKRKKKIEELQIEIEKTAKIILARNHSEIDIHMKGLHGSTVRIEVKANITEEAVY